MKVFIVTKIDFGYQEILEVFNTFEKAQSFRTSYELQLFDNGSLGGVSFYIEEKLVQ